MHLILGSKSPRRAELLASLGVIFDVRTKETEETYPADMLVEEVPLYIAEKKTNALIPELQSNEVLLCADTVVISNQRILGKPVDRPDAIQMLTSLSGISHTVVTGVVLHSLSKTIRFSCTTEVFFRTLTNEEIEFYVDTFQPYDKAGGYGIQEWIGHAAVEKIIGSYSNVVGLPTQEVYLAWKQFTDK